MIRIKLFALFIAFALVALVRPRKCLELLEAADRGVASNPGHVPPRPMPESRREVQPTKPWRPIPPVPEVVPDHYGGWLVKLGDGLWHRWCPQPECPLPPAGWRCTRRAGHDGPCAAVVK